MIAVRGTQIFDVTNSAGSFALAGLPSGRQMIRILYRDSVSYEHPIKLTSGKALTLSVLLDVDAIELAPIVVEAKTLRAERSLAGFYDRRKWGFGRFYTRQDLVRRRGLPLQSLLGESGVSMRCRLRDCIPLTWSAGRQCIMSLYLDGVRLPSDQLDLIHLDDLAGVDQSVESGLAHAGAREILRPFLARELGQLRLELGRERHDLRFFMV